MEQLVDLKRFADEIPRPPLDRFNGIFDGSETGDDDGNDVGVAIEGRIDDGRSVDTRETQVGDDDVEREVGQSGEGILSRLGLLDGVPAIDELLGERLPQWGLVFDEQDMFHRIRHLASAKSLT
jgi:hypothetical protein